MRDQLLQIKVSEEEKRIFQELADKSGAKSLSEWVRMKMESPSPERVWRNGPGSAAVEKEKATQEEKDRLARLWTKTHLSPELQEKIKRETQEKAAWNTKNTEELVEEELEMTEEEIRAEEKRNFEAIPVVEKGFIPPPPLPK